MRPEGLSLNKFRYLYERLVAIAFFGYKQSNTFSGATLTISARSLWITSPRALNCLLTFLRSLLHLSGLPVEVFAFLFFVALMAGFIDTLAGGGGLLTIPALLMSGIPPLFALGTNKLQSTMGSGTATFMMLWKNKIVFGEIRHKMLTAFIGATIGTLLVQLLNTQYLSFIIPIVLTVIAAYFLFSPKVEEDLENPKLSKRKYQYLVVPAIGCYDGMFGPGTGSFFIVAGVALRGKGLLDSTAIAKSLNFATNVASLIVFLFVGKIFWAVGILMMAGQFTGAWLGSHMLFKINPKYLRYIVIVMCLAMLVRYAIKML